MTKPQKPKFSKGFYSSIILAAVVLCILIYALAGALSGSDLIRNVRANGISLEGLNLASAEEKLERELPSSFGSISLRLGDNESLVDVSEFIKGYDYELTAQNAYNVGRSGNVFSRMLDVIVTTVSPKNIPVEVFYDEDVMYKTIEKILEGEDDQVEEFSYEVLDDSLLFHTGHEGSVPDKTVIAEALLEAVRNFDYEKPVKFENKTRKPADIDADEFLKNLSPTAQDASYHKDPDGEIFVDAHKVGIVLDEKEFKKLVSENRGPDKSFSVKAEIVKPKFTKEMLEGRVFTKTLSAYTTHYNTGDVSRSKNVALATSLIDGTILLPGDEFSYNGTVGERTAEAGFSIAHVYVNGETVDGMGGGICQVSSTLYNSVLYADLKVTERLNHQLTVGYVPLGQDATVDYGNIDFKFVNDTDYPIKIDAKTTGGGALTIKLLGYRDDPTFDVKIQNTTISVIPSPEEEIEDPTLPEGERKYEKKGGSGAVVETYKTVTRNGETTRTFVSKSVYGAGKSVVRVGTGPAEGTENTEGTEGGTEGTAEGSTEGENQTPAETLPATENTNQNTQNSEEVVQ